VQTTDSTNGYWTFGPSSTNQRIYRYFDDNIFDVRLSAEIPIGRNPDLPRKIKLGASYMENKQKNKQFVYETELGQDFGVFPDYKAFLTEDNFRIQQGNQLPIYYTYLTGIDNEIVGERRVLAGYVIGDIAIIKPLRLSGGLRVEHSDLYADVAVYEHLAPDDSARVFDESIGPAGIKIDYLRPSVIQQVNYLPSVNLLYKFIDNEKLAFNGRLNYSKSIVRPSSKEVLNIWREDIELNTYVTGNPELKITEIDNYDVRFEAFFASGEFVSLSGFYKYFTNPIQLVNALLNYSWVNADNSKLYGVELEGKKSLVKNLSLSTNLTYVYARASFADSVLNYPVNGNKPMYGQAPYVVNAMLDYTNEKYKTTATLTYNVQGPKLVAVFMDSWSNAYELPRKLLDFKISKGFGDHVTVDFKIRNLLNAPVHWVFDEHAPKWTDDDESLKLKTIWKDAFGLNIGEYPFTWGANYRKYTTGRSFVLSVAYRL
jgi:outer membrane receptor protein involved in Fe transport